MCMSLLLSGILYVYVYSEAGSEFNHAFYSYVADSNYGAGGGAGGAGSTGCCCYSSMTPFAAEYQIIWQSGPSLDCLNTTTTSLFSYSCGDDSLVTTSGCQLLHMAVVARDGRYIDGLVGVLRCYCCYSVDGPDATGGAPGGDDWGTGVADSYSDVSFLTYCQTKIAVIGKADGDGYCSYCGWHSLGCGLEAMAASVAKLLTSLGAKSRGDIVFVGHPDGSKSPEAPLLS